MAQYVYIQGGSEDVEEPFDRLSLTLNLQAEARIDADPNGLGHQVYTKLCQRLIENGTTSVAFHGTQSVTAKYVLTFAVMAAVPNPRYIH